MNKLLLTTLFMLLPIIGLAQQVPQDRLQRIQEATVRVSVSGGTGTGTIFKENDNYYYVLTNAHVVGNSKFVNIECHKNHWPSPKMRGEVIAKRKVDNASFDVAVVKIAKKLFRGIRMPVIPLSKTGPDANEILLITCGCQAGASPSIQLCIVGDNRNDMIYYTPTALPGRSGSMLTDINGLEIKGLVAWMTGGSNPRGLAMSSAKIYDWVDNAVRLNVIQMNKETVDDFLFSLPIDIHLLPKDAIPIPLAKVDENFEKYVLALQTNPENPWLKKQDKEDSPIVPKGGEEVKPPETPPIQPAPPKDDDKAEELDPFDPNTPDEDILPEGPDGSKNPWLGPLLPNGPKDAEPNPNSWPVRRLIREGFIRLFSDMRKFRSSLDSIKLDVDGLRNRPESVTQEELEKLETRLGDRLRQRWAMRDAERAQWLQKWQEQQDKLADRLGKEKVDPGKISDRVTRGVLAGFLNLPVIRAFRDSIRLLIKIVFWGAIILGVNWAGTQFFGVAWFGMILKSFVRLVKNIVSGVVSGVSELFKREPDTEKEDMAEQLKALQERLKELGDK